MARRVTSTGSAAAQQTSGQTKGDTRKPATAPIVCGGAFVFGGAEADGAVAGTFLGGIYEVDSVEGKSAGTLAEVWGGGEAGDPA